MRPSCFGEYYKGAGIDEDDVASRHFAVQTGGGLESRSPWSIQGLRVSVDYRYVFAGDHDRNQLGLVCAYVKAVEAGSSNAYVHDRLASLEWQPDADHKTLAVLESHLSNATRLNVRYADAYSWLGELRSILGTGDPVGRVMLGVSLEPYEAIHRLPAAGVFLRQRKLDEAEVQAKNALTLSKPGRSAGVRSGFSTASPRRGGRRYRPNVPDHRHRRLAQGTALPR